MITSGIMIVGGLLIFIGLIFNLARNNSGVRKFLEITLLGGPGIFEKNKSYSGIVRWLGWESILAGAVLMIPTPILINLAAAVFIVAMIVLVYYRYKRAMKEMDEHEETKNNLSSGADKTPSSE